MIYLDTSIVAPLVIAEDASDAVEAFVRRIKPGELATSLWTRVELASLVARKHRKGELSESQAQAVRGQFEQLLEESFALVLPAAADYLVAAKFLSEPKIGLRAGDAFHLAIAANNGASKILTLDAGFMAAGKLLKLPVSRGIKP